MPSTNFDSPTFLLSSSESLESELESLVFSSSLSVLELSLGSFNISWDDLPFPSNFLFSIVVSISSSSASSPNDKSLKFLHKKCNKVRKWKKFGERSSKVFYLTPLFSSFSFSFFDAFFSNSSLLRDTRGTISSKGLFNTIAFLIFCS